MGKKKINYAKAHSLRLRPELDRLVCAMAREKRRPISHMLREWVEESLTRQGIVAVRPASAVAGK